MRWRRRTKGLHSAPPAARSAFHTDSEAASSPTGSASHTWVATRSQRNWLMMMRVPGGPKPKCRATYCQKCWGTKMCRRRASSGPVTASTTQLPLAEPAATGRDASLQGEPDDADGMDVGELGDDEGPGAHVQADQPQRLDSGRDPLVAEEAVAVDQTAVLPAT